MEIFDGSVGAITASVLKKGLGEDTTVGFIVCEQEISAEILANMISGIRRYRKRGGRSLSGVLHNLLLSLFMFRHLILI